MLNPVFKILLTVAATSTVLPVLLILYHFVKVKSIHQGCCVTLVAIAVLASIAVTKGGDVAFRHASDTVVVSTTYFMVTYVISLLVLLLGLRCPTSWRGCCGPAAYENFMRWRAELIWISWALTLLAWSYLRYKGRTDALYPRAWHASCHFLHKISTYRIVNIRSLSKQIKGKEEENKRLRTENARLRAENMSYAKMPRMERTVTLLPEPMSQSLVDGDLDGIPPQNHAELRKSSVLEKDKRERKAENVETDIYRPEASIITWNDLDTSFTNGIDDMETIIIKLKVINYSLGDDAASKQEDGSKPCSATLQDVLAEVSKLSANIDALIDDERDAKERITFLRGRVDEATAQVAKATAQLIEQRDAMKTSIRETTNQARVTARQLEDLLSEKSQISEEATNAFAQRSIALIHQYRLTAALVMELFSLGKRVWAFLRISHPRGLEKVWYYSKLDNRRSITVWQSPGADSAQKTFEYDQVFLPEEGPTHIARMLWVFLFALVQGRDVCILADGNSCTGKSYTLFTQLNSIICRVADALFAPDTHKFIESIIFSAVYVRGMTLNKWFSIPEGQQLPKGVTGRYREGVTEFTVTSKEGFTALVYKMSQQRSELDRETKVNPTSSRCSLLSYITVKVKGQDSATLSLVDLVGNERQEDGPVHPEQEAERREITSDRFAYTNVLREYLKSIAKLPATKVSFGNSQLTKHLERSFGVERSGRFPLLVILAHVSVELNLEKYTLHTLTETSKWRLERQFRENRNTKSKSPITQEAFFNKIDGSISYWQSYHQRAFQMIGNENIRFHLDTSLNSQPSPSFKYAEMDMEEGENTSPPLDDLDNSCSESFQTQRINEEAAGEEDGDSDSESSDENGLRSDDLLDEY